MTKKLRFINFLLLFVWIAMMGIMIWFSDQSADVSTEQSLYIGKFVCSIVIKDYSSASSDVRLEYARTLDHFIRKSAHFCEYAALGALTFNTVFVLLCHFGTRLNRSFKKIYYLIFPVLWCLLFAISDEIHQYFVEGRYCSALDVLLDTAGAACGVILVFLIRNSVKPYRKEDA